MTDLTINQSYPPNYEDILKVLPEASKPGVLFCYGDTLYNPSGAQVPPWVLDHEKVHSARQEGSVGLWWQKYLADPEFRFQEELLAHIKEYKSFKNYCKSVEKRGKYLFTISQRLSSPLYNSGYSQAYCRKLIKAG